MTGRWSSAVHLLAIAVLAGSWISVGFGLLPRKVRQASNLPLVGASALALGAGVNAVILTILAMAHQFRRGPVLAVEAAGLVVSLLIGGRALSEWRSRPRDDRGCSRAETLGKIALALVLLGTLFATLAPPSSMDAVVYHLRVPREFLRMGFWGRLDVVQSFQPMYVEMLFGEGLVVGGGVVAALVHWVLGLGAIAAAAAWGRRLGGNPMWAALIFGATGLYVWESTSAFIDLGLTLFSALAFSWSTEPEPEIHAAILSGTFAGLAAGSKFTGLIVGLLASMAAFMVLWPNWRRGLWRASVIGGLTLLIAMPWYVRNALLTGNPIYPLANRLFGKPWVAFSTFTYGYGNDLLHFVSSPFDLLGRGQVFDQGWSVGPALLALVPIGFSARKSRLALVVAASMALWWFIWYFSSPQTRLLLPILPMAAGLASVGVRAIATHGSRSLRVLTAAVVAIGVAGGLGTSALAIKTKAKVIAGLESEAQYLERNSWNYSAYEQVNRRLSANARVASIGLGHNLYYVDRDIRYLGEIPMSAGDLRTQGFTHELWTGSCPLEPIGAGRRSLAEGTYPLRASRLAGGVFAQACYRLSELSGSGLGGLP
jgi:hypothetical protein